MDKIQELLAHQKAFQTQRKKFDGINQTEDTKEIILWMHTELSELLEALNVKVYSKDIPSPSESNVKDNIIDLFKFNLMLMNEWGMDSDEVVEEFYRKSRVIEQKWTQAQDVVLQDGNCICIDIDGVLCDLISTWKEFLNFQGISPVRENQELLDFSEYLDDDHRLKYDLLKSEFRSSGRKRNALVYPTVSDTIKELSKKYQILIVSARPVDKYRRMYADTIEWLEMANIKYDSLIFESKKRDWVLKHQEKIVFCVEDDPNQALSLANVGIQTFLIDREYNMGITHENITRIKDFKEIEC